MSEEKTPQAEATANQEADAAKQEAEKQQNNLDLDALLEQEESLRIQFEQKVSGLKRALEKERENNKSLLNTLRKLGAQKEGDAEEGSSTEEELRKWREATESLKQELAEKERRAQCAEENYLVERVRNAVIIAAMRKGARSPELVASVAMSGDWYANLEIVDGEVKNLETVLDKIFSAYPELTAPKLGTPIKRELPQVKSDGNKLPVRL